jgi:hypothetical protein
MKQIKIDFLKLRLVYGDDKYGKPVFAYAVLGKKWFWLTPIIDTLYKIYDAIDYVMPQFYSIGLHDCDTGGRIYAWYCLWFFNGYTKNKYFRKYQDSGDGPDTIRKTNLMGYLRFKKYEREKQTEYKRNFGPNGIIRNRY